MRNGKPRGKTPSLIGSTLGTPRKRIVQKESHCKRCNASILKGTVCFEIPQLGGAFTNYRLYCDDCFRSILEQTEGDLDDLLNGDPRS